MSNILSTYSMASLLVAFLVSISIAEVGQLPAGAKVLDPDVILYSWPHATISPNGEWVAYISRGFVCICKIADPRPHQLFEVPNTWTHYLAQPEQAHAMGSQSAAMKGLSREERRAVSARMTHKVFGLQWTRNQDGIIWGVRKYNNAERQFTADIWHASLGGTTDLLAHVEVDWQRIVVNNVFYVSPNHRHLVFPGRRPLIWNIAQKRPQATCFLYLIPATSRIVGSGLRKTRGNSSSLTKNSRSWNDSIRSCQLGPTASV